MTVSARGVAILAAILILGGIGVGFWRLESPASAPPPAQGAAATSLDQVRDMLRQRAARLSAGDVEGYLKPLSAQARAVEEPIARGALSAELAEIDLAFIPPATIADNATSFADVPVDLLYRYKGLPDDNLFRLRITCTIEKQSGSWTVTSSSIQGPQNPEIPLWAHGPIDVSHSKHFLILSAKGTARVQEATELAETAWGNLVAKLPLQVDPVQLVELAANRAQFNAIANKPQPAGELAYAFGQYDETTKVMRHIVVDLSTLFGPGAVLEHQTELQPLQVFQHELGHLALTRFDAPGLPSWVAEAAAMYLSGERRVDAWRSGLEDGEWDTVSLAQLDTAPDLPGEDYPYANATGLYLVQTFGAAAFFDFYRAYEYQSGPGATGALVLQRFGLSLTQLDAKTRAYIRDAVGSG